MGATIDDEVADRPDSFIWQPFSHAAAAIACDRTDLVAVSDIFEEKVEAIRQRYGAERAYTDYQQVNNPALKRRGLCEAHAKRPLHKLNG